jgi:hypothetical protein
MRRRTFLEVMAGAAAASPIEGSEDQKNKAEHGHETESQKESLDLNGAVEFVEKAGSPVSPEKLKGKEFCEQPVCCVDDRQEGKDFAVPGGDEGLMANLMTALKEAGITSEEQKREALKWLVKFRGGEDKIHFHTDEEGMKDPNNHKYELAEGCGHFRYSADNPTEYKLTNEDVDLIYECLLNAASKGAHRDILPGPHEAKAVFVVDVLNMALEHHAEVNKKQVKAYVYNRAYHTELLKKMAAELAPVMQVNPQKLETALLKAADAQLNATVNHLAKGKPLYTVGFHDGKKLAVKKEGVI